mgnify:FL=1
MNPFDIVFVSMVNLYLFLIAHQSPHENSNIFRRKLILFIILEVIEWVNDIDCLSIGNLNRTNKALLLGDIVMLYIDSY